MKAVRTLTGNAVWEAGDQGVYDRELLDAALDQLFLRKVPEGKTIREALRKDPDLFVVDYADGTRANIFTLNVGRVRGVVFERR